MGKADAIAESMNYMKFIAHNEGKVLGHKSISWSKPSNGQFKLNINGSINRDTKKAIVGGVLKDYNGKANFSFVIDVCYCLVVTAELEAIMLGIEIARSRRFKQFMLESDSFVAISLLNHGCPSFHLS